jgi:hypothetical protein
VVDAGFEGGLGRPAQREVPFEEVGLERDGVVVGRGGGGEFVGFADWAGGLVMRQGGREEGRKGRWRTDAADGGGFGVEFGGWGCHGGREVPRVA